MRSQSDVLRDFGQAVRSVRKAGDLSQEALAEKAGLHRTYVGGIERGERNVSLVNIVALAEALSVTPAALFEGWAGTASAQGEPLS